LRLDCPASGECDHWDRVGSIQLVDAKAEPTELTRFVTAYRVPMCAYVEATPWANLLKGPKRVKSFIDTWVKEGHVDGDGWRTTVQFVFYPGKAMGADEVITIWGFKNVTVGEIEPDVNIDSQFDPVPVALPADAKRVDARLFSTGHSFGNTDDCAEFCEMRMDIIANGEKTSVNPWRDDCAENPVSNQMGTWEYARNGWCPGAIAVGDKRDLTSQLQLSGSNSIDFDIRLANGEEYDNLSPVDLLPYEFISVQLHVYK
jgi:hypothetical protein